MTSPQQEEYLRRQAEETQRKQQKSAQRKKQTPEEAARRWRRWRNIAVFSALALVLGYYVWVYLVPMLTLRMFPVKLPDEVPLEEVVAEFNDDSDEATKKYNNKRIVVVGKLIKEIATKDGPPEARGGRIYYELAETEGEEARVPCEFFDQDDAETVTAGDSVKLSGVLKRVGPRKYKLMAAAIE
jgi:hypothetical protein